MSLCAYIAVYAVHMHKAQTSMLSVKFGMRSSIQKKQVWIVFELINPFSLKHKNVRVLNITIVKQITMSITLTKRCHEDTT
jgi:hypothetical protein